MLPQYQSKYVLLMPYSSITNGNRRNNIPNPYLHFPYAGWRKLVFNFCARVQKMELLPNFELEERRGRTRSNSTLGRFVVKEQLQPEYVHRNLTTMHRNKGDGAD